MDDIGLYFQDFVTSLDELPSDIHHHFTELRAHEQDFQQIRRNIHQREKTLQSYLRTHGYAKDKVHPQETSLIAKSHQDFEKAQDIADQKIGIAQRAMELVQKHLKRLETDLKRHEAEERLARTGGGSGALSTPRAGIGSVGSGVGSARAASAIAAAGSAGGLDTPTGIRRTTSGLSGVTLRDGEHGVGGGGDLTAVPLTTPRQQKRKWGTAISGSAHGADADGGVGAGGSPGLGGLTGLQTPISASGGSRSSLAGRGGRGAAGRGHKKLKGRQSGVQQPHMATTPTRGGHATGQNVHIIENIETTTGIESDEPLYCICQQVSYGEMVACDGENCPHEWFHYECVGLTSPPQGAWYCVDCLANQKKIKKK